MTRAPAGTIPAALNSGGTISSADADLDGMLDIYLAQNFYSPQVETGRMAGGVSQLLLERGDGTFDAVPAHRSGLLVGGDAASLTLADLDGTGRPSFVVGMNNAAPQAFVNQVFGGTRALNVRLDGGAGNPHAFGARLSLGKQSAEIYAGGGYLSQSPPVARFSMSEGTAGAKLKVRWPDGSESEHEVPEDGGDIKISIS